MKREIFMCDFPHCTERAVWHISVARESDVTNDAQFMQNLIGASSGIKLVTDFCAEHGLAFVTSPQTFMQAFKDAA